MKADSSVRHISRRTVLLCNRFHLTAQDSVDNSCRYKGKNKCDQIGYRSHVLARQEEGSEQQEAKDKYSEEPDRLFCSGHGEIADHFAGLAVHGEEEILPLPFCAQKPYRKNCVLRTPVC